MVVFYSLNLTKSYPPIFAVTHPLVGSLTDYGQQWNPEGKRDGCERKVVFLLCHIDFQAASSRLMCYMENFIYKSMFV